MARAAILGLLATEVSELEFDFFRDADPWGFILFARNIDRPEQVRRLTSMLREAVGRNAPVLIDQEGGRVQRMRPPHWRRWSPVLNLFDCPDENAGVEAARLRYRIIADELADVGIDVNCAPLLDVLSTHSHEAIGCRALGRDPGSVIRRGKAVIEGLKAGGVLPVLKHIPGQGRATLDSHAQLPVVTDSRDELDQTDFEAFAALRHEPLGMTGHVVFEAIDPQNPATHSPTVIRAVREVIGFEGLLMTDDLSMEALRGPIGERASRALGAGCDVVLHCNGKMAEMTEIVASTGLLDGISLARAERAEAARGHVEEIDIDAAVARYQDLTGEEVYA